FHMAQQVIPAAQIVPRYHTIGRCNNYAMLQSIPCSPECKIVRKSLLDHPLSYALTATVDFMLDTKEFTYTVDMFRVTLHLLVETPENPFVTPVNIQTIESFMNRVGYQGVVDKVSAFYTKNLAQPWQTMFKKKEAIQYPRFIKLIIADLMKKFLNIPQRIDEDYHSIKDDIPLDIRASDDFKEYKTMFVNVDVPMNQPQLVVSTQGTHRSTPRAHRTPILTVSPQGKKRKQIVREFSSPQKSLKITVRQQKVVEVERDDDDSEARLELGSHKENPEHVDDDDDEEKVDETKDAEMGSLETRTKEMQTPIPTTPRSPRKILSSDKNIDQELTDTVLTPTATTSKDPHSKRCISSKYSHLPGALRRICRRQGDDGIHSQRHDDHQEDDAPPEGEKRVKLHKASKSLKSASGSSSKHSSKDSTTYVFKQQQQQ
ncbi:hypothetical protein Tco_0631423, partial [Tanacetum coccineum]